MVVRAAPEGWYLVTQPDHAALAGELAHHWTLPQLPGERDPEFLEAVARHDSGWQQVDAAPRFHPDGAPVSFMEWPLLEAVGVWRRSVADARALGETAGYVVARHFCLLGEMARGRRLGPAERDALEAFLEECDPAPRQERLEHVTSLLQVCDLLSMCLVTGGRMNTALLRKLGIAAEFEAGHQAANDCLRLEPYPFDSTLSLSCPARFLPNGGRVPQPSSDMRFLVAPGLQSVQSL